MARRSEHSQEQIRKMVLEAAEDIVQEQGFSALKVRKIAADIGYTVGSIYMVFTNMNDLKMHIKARTWLKMRQYLEARVEKSIKAQTVSDFAMNYLDFTIDNEKLWRMLFEHQLPAGEAVPGWYLQQSDGVIELFYQVLKPLDTLHSDAQIRQAAQTLIKSMQGVCMQLMMHQQSSENISLAKGDVVLLVNCFMRGWMTDTE